jgi:murein DD-endopeptidase MepM/ murein hydrolase activator NlpD
VAGALCAVAVLVAVPAGAAAPDPPAGAGIDPRLRYPMTMPVDGRVESLIGGGCPSTRSHSGIDISSPASVPTPVLASYAGFARAVDTGNGYGLTVEIVHGGDGVRYLSRYAHLSRALVPAEGRWVAQGEVIGTTGATGNAQTVHLHFEVRDGADAVVDLNPAFRPCRRDAIAGAPMAVDLPGLLSSAAVAVAALEANTWAATGVAPGATAPTVPDCRYWDRARSRGEHRCALGAGDGAGGVVRLDDGPAGGRAGD